MNGTVLLGHTEANRTSVVSNIALHPDIAILNSTCHAKNLHGVVHRSLVYPFRAVLATPAPTEDHDHDHDHGLSFFVSACSQHRTVVYNLTRCPPTSAGPARR